MKKVISAFLACAIAAGSAICASASQSNLMGDVNFDGQVSIKDSTMIQKHCAGMIRFSEAQRKCADPDGNGKINVSDATYLQRQVAGIAQKKNYTEEEAIEAGNKAVTDFGVKLLQKTKKEKDNVLVSPVSVMYALSMTANGAGGKTLKQMENTLGLPLNAMNKYFKAYPSLLKYKGEQEDKFSIANSIWCNTLYSDVEYRQDFVDTAKDVYSAEANKLPFNTEAQNKINNWVSENTDGMVDGIMDQINPMSFMYLINTLAFDGKWLEPYDPNYMVRDGKFTNADYTKSDAKYMCSEEFRYLSDDKAQGFVKLFKDGNYAFAALLPNSGNSVDSYLNSLTGERISNILSNVKSGKTVVWLPKFKINYDTDLADVLQSLGMTDAFDEQYADFSGMISNTPFNPYIGSVIHKTVIDVNEIGTKAAAATSVEIKAGATPEEPKEVKLTRPFIYMLINTKTNTPFFIGTVDELK